MSVIPIEFATPEYDASVKLRLEILRLPLSLDFKAADLEQEYQHFHLAYFDEQLQIQGCLVLNPMDRGRIKMRQVAVAESAQGQGIGRQLVLASEVFAKEHGFVKMILNARETAVPFYLKLEYKKVGERFEEVSIPHFRMEKNLR